MKERKHIKIIGRRKGNISENDEKQANTPTNKHTNKKKKYCDLQDIFR
jgi:hypothetical protein